MYGLEIILGIFYEGFEPKVSELFSAIESSCKGCKRTPGSIKKEIGSNVRLLELGNFSICPAQ